MLLWPILINSFGKSIAVGRCLFFLLFFSSELKYEGIIFVVNMAILNEYLQGGGEENCSINYADGVNLVTDNCEESIPDIA